LRIFKKTIDFAQIKQMATLFGIAEENFICENVSDDHLFTNVSDLADANINSICFYENEKYFSDFGKSRAGLILVPLNLEANPSSSQVFVKAEKPYFTFMTLVSWWLNEENKTREKNISPLASIHPSVKLGENVHIGAYAVLEEGVCVGDNAYIGASVVLMRDVIVGQSSKIYPNVVLYENCKIGNNVVIHSGSVIGADGFGYTQIAGKQIKIPQVGDVVIEDDVEIGANTCIDRSTLGTTLIKSNTKIDNLVQIGHNCSIEESSVLCSQVGLAGSTQIGKSVYLAGQVGIAGHCKIEDNTLIGAQSGVPGSLATGKYFGTPAIPAFDSMKIVASLKDLPEVVKYVKKLMKEG
jgi:UDP-3-O-[3-hydroxymyristoyl] glucosamine N-acyltransferase